MSFTGALWEVHSGLKTRILLISKTMVSLYLLIPKHSINFKILGTFFSVFSFTYTQSFIMYLYYRDFQPWGGSQTE